MGSKKNGFICTLREKNYMYHKNKLKEGCITQALTSKRVYKITALFTTVEFGMMKL